MYGTAVNLVNARRRILGLQNGPKVVISSDKIKSTAGSVREDDKKAFINKGYAGGLRVREKIT